MSLVPDRECAHNRLPAFGQSPIHYSGSTVAQLSNERGSDNPESTSVDPMAVDDSHAGTPRASISGVLPDATPPLGTLEPTLDGAAARRLTQANNGVTLFRLRPQPGVTP
jgi:hypothetical protein